MTTDQLADEIAWNSDGLAPVIVQDAATGDVLMMAWTNREAFRKTIETRESHFFSRSRGMLWHKGATSGHVQQVVEIRLDCDGDVILFRVRQKGAACHEGYASCFFRSVDENGDLRVNRPPVFDPATIYSKRVET